MSNETKFTGRWLKASYEEVVDKQGLVIATFNGVGTSIEEDYANATLFKTAPKLYALLEKINKGNRRYMEGFEIYEDIERLLAEARGEE